jgi:DNA processing protein
MFAMTLSLARPDEERAAVLALVDASPRDWHRTATLIIEAGGARRLLGPPAWTGLETFDTELAEELAARVPESALDDKLTEIRRLAEAGITVLTVLDEDYPVNLRLIYNLPPVLYVRGGLLPEDGRAIAVVGTRQASSEGLQRAAELATELAHHEVTVISGLARGIDTAAHEAALAAGGRTIAVLGTGIEAPIYPAENRGLAERILERGALVSQFRPASPPTRFSFPMRNVVMSGMSAGTVVIEASSTSGAKMQARLALEHGKPVFLLESLVTRQAWARDYAERRGARVVQSVDDIVAALTAMQAPTQQLSLV